MRSRCEPLQILSHPAHYRAQERLPEPHGLSHREPDDYVDQVVLAR